MAYKVVYLPASLSDLESILAYLAPHNLTAANVLLDKLDHRISELAGLPKMGKAVTDPELQGKGYRVLVVEDYYVFYIVHEERKEVKIYRILSSRQDYLQWVE